MKLIDKFEYFSIKYIPRSQNDLENALVVHASSSQTLEATTSGGIIIDILYRPSCPR
jgi:hypothetical protein